MGHFPYRKKVFRLSNDNNAFKIYIKINSNQNDVFGLHYISMYCRAPYIPNTFISF